MKKLLALSTLAGLAACQPSTPATQAAPLAAPIAPVAPAKPPVAVTAAPTPIVLPDSLTPAMRATLRQVNLARLFASAQPKRLVALDGFFGTNPQRLSLAILTATRDSLRPELLHVTGKTRYRRQVAAFTGDICLTRLTDFYDQGLLLSQGENSFIQDTTSTDGHVTNAQAYSATAAFRFISAAPATQVLTGRALLDFWIMDDGTVGSMHAPAEGIVLDEAAAKGSGLILQGNWQDHQTQDARPFLVSCDVFLISPGIIADFGVGDRGVGVNPKYARLGWNTYWENDEWWADSPTPTLSL